MNEIIILAWLFLGIWAVFVFTGARIARKFNRRNGVIISEFGR